MNKLDKQIDNILDKYIYVYFGERVPTRNLIKSQIKQSILKAIVEKSPKKKDFMKYHGDYLDEVLSFNDAIKKFESVIKEVLDTKPII